MILTEGRNNKSGSLPIPQLLNLIDEVDPVASLKVRKILTNFKPKLMMNKLRRFSQEREGEQLALLTEKYLGVSLEYLGMVRDDPHVIDSSELMMPFVLQFPGCGASKDIYSLVGKLNIEDKLGRFAVKRSTRLKQYIKTERRYWYH